MRPVNLIPPDERRGDSAPLRTGALVYVLTAGLAVLLLGIVVVALTSKQVSDREAEKASLEQELQQATARAQSVQAFTDFRTAQQQRSDTVNSLAESRFDWSRVLNELALVLPSDIEISCMTATASDGVNLEGGEGCSASSTLRSAVAGPALEITGCAPSHDSVAGFVSTLEDIDGVTRVGLESSGLGDEGGSGGGATGGGGGQEDCQVHPEIAKFNVVAAFDAVPVPATATTSPSVPAPAPPSTGADQSQVADGQTQQNVQRASATEQTTKAQNAQANLTPGG